MDQVSDGYSAISHTIARQYDLILMDINLSSEMNGIEATRAIRIQDNYHDVPVVAITGYAAPEERERIMHFGFDQFIAKPFDKETLVSKIREILNIKQGGDGA